MCIDKNATGIDEKTQQDEIHRGKKCCKQLRSGGRINEEMLVQNISKQMGLIITSYCYLDQYKIDWILCITLALNSLQNYSCGDRGAVDSPSVGQFKCDSVMILPGLHYHSINVSGELPLPDSHSV